jgi:hypothetical protein
VNNIEAFLIKNRNWCYMTYVDTYIYWSNFNKVWSIISVLMGIKSYHCLWLFCWVFFFFRPLSSLTQVDRQPQLWSLWLDDCICSQIIVLRLLMTDGWNWGNTSWRTVLRNSVSFCRRLWMENATGLARIY